METAGNIARIATSYIKKRETKKAKVEPAKDNNLANPSIFPAGMDDITSKSTANSNVSGGLTTHSKNSTDSSSYTDTKISITFLGINVTSKFGVQMMKVVSIIVPLIPTFILVAFNGYQLEGLLGRSNLLDKNYKLVSQFCFEVN